MCVDPGDEIVGAGKVGGRRRGGGRQKGEDREGEPQVTDPQKRWMRTQASSSRALEVA